MGGHGPVGNPRNPGLTYTGAATGFLARGREGGGAIFLGTKLFQKLGTNLKKKDQHSRKRDNTQEKG